MLILMMNMHHGLGNRQKNKIKMIGITLKMGHMTIMLNKKNFMKLKKLKTWNHKLNKKQLDIKLNKIYQLKKEINSIQNGNKFSW
jgi:hypothetical protein